MVNEGYLIVQKSKIAFKTYEQETKKSAFRDYLEQLRNVTAHSPDDYKGISRYPIALSDIISHSVDEEDVFEDTVFIQHEKAASVFRQLENREDYEIIKVSLPSIIVHSKSLLGYDVGYVGGDCFSVICDSVVMPRWHPPSPDEISTLADKIRKLNQNLLFPDEGSAKDFCEYYTKQEWGEKPVYPGQISIIGISHVNPLADLSTGTN